MRSLGFLALGFCAALNAQPQDTIHHQLTVLLDPATSRIEVTDTVTLPASLGRDDIAFALNANLAIDNSPRDLQRLGVEPLQALQGINETGGLAAQRAKYTVDLARRSQTLELSYTGTLFDPTQQSGAQYSQSFAETSGLIDPRGVYLNRGSAWIPEFGDALVTFELSVAFAESAAAWSSLSQGERLAPNVWRSDQPMEEVYLIAAAFTEYSAVYKSVLDATDNARSVDVLALLRSPDANLAATYLDATQRYLALYEPLLGAYPFTKFALVENFWETGYGMPSFTLLGEKIIRFPFIITSSYPHEILHNWWGNGVYPDYATGNWSEGLTAYLADHLFQEVEGGGPAYRKDMLARYKNAVSASADFPLSEFTSRNSAATQAVGYGKSLMLWHMLRLEIGDALFLEGLRAFYREAKFTRASFEDIERIFSRVAERDLAAFFAQWVQRRGAPELALSVAEERGDKARLNFAQVQEQEPFEFTVTAALYYSGQASPTLVDLTIDQRAQGFVADDYSRLEAVVVDPYFDLFRRLDRAETPPTVGELFGASSLTFVLPSSSQGSVVTDHWRELVESFGAGVAATTVLDSEIDALPTTSSVWILGRDNRFAPAGFDAAPGATRSVSAAEGDDLTLAGNVLDYAERSSVFVARHPQAPELALGFIDIDQPEAVPGMIEKLPHYGKYSYLSFAGDEPTNDVKGVWSASASPLQWTNPELDHAPQLASLPDVAALAEMPPRYLAAKLSRHIEALTQPALLGRGIVKPSLATGAGIAAATDLIEDQFRRIGLRAVGGSYRQRWTATLANGDRQGLTNVVGLIPGSDPTLAPVVFGAHYDHLGLNANGTAYSGADDNASGVAVLIEVAATLRRTFTPTRPILVVAFSGEESGLLGSRYFIDNPLNGLGSTEFYAMINLDAVGRLGGRKLQVFGSESAYEWPFMAQGIGFTLGIESEFPTQALASSDHVSFLNAGVPALHLFSGLHGDYHRVSDTADEIDYAGLSDVAAWSEEALRYLGGNEGPLRVTLANAAVVVAPQGTGARRVSLGTLPDFGYEGEGVRVSGVTPNSAAALAGIQKGDILLSFAGAALSDLQTYSNLLRAAAVGDSVVIEVLRAAERLEMTAVLTARE